MTFQIRRDTLEDPRVVALIQAHRAHSFAHTPTTSVHTLDIAALQAPDVRFFALWRGTEVLATGGLKVMTARDGEVKSMHVAETARGLGLGRRILAHIEADARDLGMARLWLETGSMTAYAPARALYARAGFALCAPFGSYVEDPNSVFMTKLLGRSPSGGIISGAGGAARSDEVRPPRFAKAAVCWPIERRRG